MPKRMNKKRKSKARMVAKKKKKQQKQQRIISPSMEYFFLGMKRIKENYNQLYLW